MMQVNIILPLYTASNEFLIIRDNAYIIRSKKRWIENYQIL